MVATLSRTKKRRMVATALGTGASALVFTPMAHADTGNSPFADAAQAIGDDLSNAAENPTPAPVPTPLKSLNDFASQALGVVPSNLLRTDGANTTGADEVASTSIPGVNDNTEIPGVSQQEVGKAVSNYNAKVEKAQANPIQHIAQSFLDAHNGHNDSNTIGQAFGAAQLPTADTIDQIGKDVDTLINKVSSFEIVNDFKTAIDDTLHSPQYEEWRTNTDSILQVDSNLHGVDRASAGISHLIDTVSTNPARAISDVVEAAGGPVNMVLNPIGATVQFATAILGPDMVSQFKDDIAESGRNFARAFADGAPSLLAIPALSHLGEFLGGAPGALAGIIPGTLLGMNHGAKLGWLLGGPALGVPGAALGWILGGLPGFILGSLPGAGIGSILGGLAPHNIIPGLLNAIPARLIGGLITGGLGLAASLGIAAANHLIFPLIGAAGASALALVALATITYGSWLLTVVPALIANGIFFGIAGIAIALVGAVISGPATLTPYGLTLASDAFLIFLGGTTVGTGVYTLLTWWIPTAIFGALLIPTIIASMTAGGLGGLLLAQISSLIGVPLITALSSIPGKVAGTTMGYLLGDGISRILSSLAGAILGGLATGIPGSILGKVLGAMTLGITSHVLGRILGTLIGETIGSLLGALLGAEIGKLIGQDIGKHIGRLIGIPVALGLWALISSINFGTRMGDMLADPHRLPAQLQRAADKGWRHSKLGQLMGTLEYNFYHHTETGRAWGDLLNRINSLYHTMSFLDGRRLREMLMRGGLLGGTIGAIRHAIKDTLPGGILGALVLGPLGILPGALIGRVIGAPLGAIPGTILGNLIGGPLGAIPGALLGRFNPLNLVNAVLGGIAATIPGAVLGALAGKGISHLIGLATAAITGPLSFLPWLVALNLGLDALGIPIALLGLGAAIVPPLAIATAQWIIIGLALTAWEWIPGFIISSLARATATVAVGVGAWSGIIPQLVPFAAASGTVGFVANAAAGFVAFINWLFITGGLTLSLFTVWPTAFALSIPFFIFPALAVPTAIILSKPLMIPVALGLSALTGLRHGFNADVLSSLINIPLGALLGGLAAFPLGFIPAHIISKITRTLAGAMIGDALGRGVGSSIGALAGAFIGQHIGRIPGAIVGLQVAQALGFKNGAVLGAIFGAITGFERGFIPGVIAALITHLRAAAGSETDGTQWVDGRIVNHGGFGDVFASVPGLSGEKIAPGSTVAVPEVAQPSMGVGTAQTPRTRSLVDASSLVAA